MNKLRRRIVQIITALTINSYVIGFMQGSIYKGSLKKICVPGLNCSYCPGAWGTCPVGMLQAAVAGMLSFPSTFFIIAFLLIVGLSLGRFVCGWLCPVGLLQELLFKIPGPKLPGIERFKKLEYLQYLILIVFVLAIPFLGIKGLSTMAFCRYICPIEVLEAHLPQMIVRPALMMTMSIWVIGKAVFLLVLLGLAIIIFKPFCRYICPLGAIYSIFNPISRYRYQVDLNKCTACGVCQAKCAMDISVYQEPNHRDCMRCDECLDCPAEAIEVQGLRKGHRGESQGINLEQEP